MQDILLHLGMINDAILRERYFIPNKGGEYFSADLKFVKEYRKKLYELLKTISSSLNNYEPEIEKARSQLEELIHDVVSYMQSADKGNVMRRVAFVSNICTEVDEMVADIKRSQKKYWENQIMDTEGERLKDILTYASTEALMYGDRYEKLEGELAEYFAKKFRGLVKDNFINLIDPNDLTKDDALFLIGYIVSRREEVSNVANAFGKAHCNENVCSREDCMYPSVCEYNSQKKAYDRGLMRYNECFHALSSYLSGKFDPARAESVASNVKDPKIAEIMLKILQSKNLPEGKSFVPPLTRSQWQMVNEQTIKAILYDDIKDENKPNLNDPKEIIAYIILHKMDLSPSSGEKFGEYFVKNYCFIKDKFLHQPSEKNPYLISYSDAQKMCDEIISAQHKNQPGEE